MNSNIINIPKLVDNLSKGLNIASKAIPLYQKIKPILQNTDYLTNILNLIKTPVKEETKKENIPTKKVSNNLPTFFQ